MTRWWNEFAADVLAVIPLPLLLMLLFLAATLVAALWYWFPAWVPRRWPRLRAPRWRLRKPVWRLRWPKLRWPKLRWSKLRWSWLRWPRLRWAWLRWRRRVAEEAPAPPASVSAEEMPELPVADFANLADRLAAEGRYAEAVRERLRGMVRELIERGVIEHRPGWTVTELAAAAAARRTAVKEPLDEAAKIFSDIWYGQRPAGADHDARMKELAAVLSASLNTKSAVPVGAVP